MPTPCYMTITGANQGDMHTGASGSDSIGTQSKSGKQDFIQIQGVQSRIETPTDTQTGQPSGQRVHYGVTITKVVDKSSPPLMQALATGEQITSCTIEWYRTSTSGEQEKYYTTKYEDGTITAIKKDMPNAQDPTNAQFGHLEHVTLSYKKITETHEIAGTSGTDSWDNS